VSSGTSVTFTLTVTNGACSATDSKTVTINSPVTAVATVPSTACQGVSFTLDGTSTGTGTYQWSSVPSTGVVITNATSLDASAVVNSITTVTFTLTVTNGACSATDSKTVTIGSVAVVTADVSTTDVCSNNSTVTLNGNPLGGEWSVMSGTGTATFVDNTNTETEATITSGTAVRFIWTVTGTCGGADTTDAVTVNTFVASVADADPAVICAMTNGKLMGNDPAPGTGTWTKITGTGTVDAGQENNPDATISNLTIGATSSFEWTIVNGACESRDTVDVTVIDPGAPANGGDDTTNVCNITQVTLGAQGVGTWSVPTPDSNPSAVTFSDPSIRNPTVTGLTDGTYSFVWSISAVVGCPSTSTTRDTVKVIVRLVDKPVIAGGPTGGCSGFDYDYNVSNVEVGSTYVWSVTSGLSINGSNTDPAEVNIEVTTAGTIYVVASQGTGAALCTNSDTLAVELLANPPSDGGVFNLATCIPTNYIIETTSFDGSLFTGTWSSTNGSITFTSLTDSTTSISGLVDGVSDTLIYTITGTCGVTTYQYNIKVGGYFSELEANGPSDTLCVTQARNLNAWVNPAGNYTYYWVSNLDYNNPVINASSHIDSTTVPTYSIKPATEHNVYLVYVVDKTSQCRTDIDTAYIHALEGQDLNVPNLITPNNDNMNDYWVLRDRTTGKDLLPGSKFDLYNRWGQRVFTMDDYDNRFKADNISDGIYYFNVKSGCGDKEYKGWLQILGNTNP
ncbi:MAG: large protein, partial [Cytophagaceae bacterium]|nr:large protein [Cytophagaceae bacterium]